MYDSFASFWGKILDLPTMLNHLPFACPLYSAFDLYNPTFFQTGEILTNKQQLIFVKG